MNCDYKNFLQDFFDGVLAAAEHAAVEQHLAACDACRQELQFLQTLRGQVSQLPASIAPPRNLWPEIAARLEPKKSLWQTWLTDLRQHKNGAAESLQDLFKRDESKSVPWWSWGLRGAFALAVLIVAVGGIWLFVQTRQASWPVARLAGAPQIDAINFADAGQLQVGEWLETDDSSRAKISIGMIGTVEIAPQTRIRLVKADLMDHRLALARGKLHAEIWAPPRIFFVETASALAVDLGCEYTLEMNDEGFGFLHVMKGYVALESKKGPESVVPAGALCEIRPNLGAGTPYSENASENLRTALAHCDLASDRSDAVSTVLSEAREADTFTLWHLLFRVDPTERPRVYDRMTELISPPAGVTRAGILQGDRRMLELWADKFGLGQSWWRYWLPL